MVYAHCVIWHFYNRLVMRTDYTHHYKYLNLILENTLLKFYFHFLTLYVFGNRIYEGSLRLVKNIEALMITDEYTKSVQMDKNVL